MNGFDFDFDYCLNFLYFLFFFLILRPFSRKSGLKRHEFMNPRSVTTVIDFAWRGSEMSRDLAHPAFLFPIYAFCIGILCFDSSEMSG